MTKLAFFLPALLLLSGCSSDPAAEAPAEAAAPSSPGTPSTATANAVTTPRYTRNAPDAYFPTATGTTWDYAVTLDQAEPLYKRISYWPSGGDFAMTTSESGRYTGAIFGRGRKSFRLRLAVVAPAPEQGPLRYPQGVELKVLQDDLGIYRDVKRLYWAITSASRYEAMEVAILDGEAPGAPHQGPWDLRQDGYSMRLLFFGSRPGTAISLGDHPVERLAFVGEAAPGVLHFLREPAAEEEHAGNVSTASQELDGKICDDLFFEIGKGLTQLHQTVNGVPSMTWQLAAFQTPGSF